MKTTFPESNFSVKLNQKYPFHIRYTIEGRQFTSINISVGKQAGGPSGWSTTPESILLKTWFEQYFNGVMPSMRLPVAWDQGTIFQNQVWRVLAKIPYGTIASYSAVALALGVPRSVRAVARAIGANPFWVVIPCHRVVGATGELRGYAGGLDLKARLLQIEQAALAKSAR
jgi:methylated-DNA-[protein]-cysteine S-methyltransferase